MSVAEFGVIVKIDPSQAQSGAAAVEASLNRAATGARVAQEEMTALARQFAILRSEIDPVAAAEVRLGESTATLINAQRAGITTMQEMARLMELQTVNMEAQLQPFEVMLSNLEIETQFLRLDNAERELQTRLLRMETQLREQGVIVTSEQTAALVEQLRTQQAIRAEQQAQFAMKTPVFGAQSSSGMGMVKGFAAAAGGMELYHLVDSYGELHNRIKVVTASTEDLARVEEKLYRIAQESRTGWNETAAVYQRVSMATHEMGLTEQQVLDFTLSLNEAFKVAGVSAGEQSRVTKDLLHGLDQGVLQWRQLQAIMAQAPYVARIIAEHFHVATGELHHLATQGKITGKEIIAAFEEAAPRIKDAFGKTTPTLTDSWHQLENALMRLISKLMPIIEVFTRALGLLADAVGVVADHWELATIALAPLTGGLTLLPLVVMKGIEAFQWLGDKLSFIGDGLGWLGDKLGLTGDAFDELYAKMNAANKAVWDESLAKINKMMDQLTKVKELATGLKELAVTIRNITLEKAFSYGSFKGMDSDMDLAVDKLTTATSKNAQEMKRYGEENQRIIQQLRELDGKTSDVAEANLKMAKAVELVEKAEARHLITIAAGRQLLQHRAVDVALEQMAADKRINQLTSINDLMERENEISLQALTDQGEALAKLGKEWDKAFNDAAKSLTKLHDGLQKEIGTLGEDQTLKGLLEFRQRFLDVSHEVRDLFSEMFGQFNTELLNFLRTGEFSFKTFITNIVMDLEKLLLKRAELEIFNLVLTAIAGPAALAPGATAQGIQHAGGYAYGGNFQVGGQGGPDSQIVMFRATPGERVNVTPPGRPSGDGGGGSAAPTVVRVVNVHDPRESLGIVDSPAGEKVFVNMLRRNRGLIRGITGTR